MSGWIARQKAWIESRAERTGHFLVDVVYDRRRDTKAQTIGGALRGLSKVFAGIVRTRFWLYRNRILRDQPLGCLVVVVGNLTVGGTGKTPVVEKFARSLTERGRKVAILSRGYKSKKEPLWKRWWRGVAHLEPPPPRVVSNGREVLLGSDEAGDEPFMLARNLPGVVVLVDKNRVKAGQYAIKHFDCDTLLLDDGFQYLPLRGQLNLLMIDKGNPFGNGCLLPRGILREPIEHIRRASYVFLTKSDGRTDMELEAIIRRHKPDTDIIECTHRPQYLQAFAGSERLDLTWLRGRKVAAFSAIATPESFEEFLERLGAQLVLRRRFLDHHRFSDRQIEEIFAKALASGAACVVTTEKDAVRVPSDYQAPLPLYFLRLEVDILSGAGDFEEAVSRICFPRKALRASRNPLRRRSMSRPPFAGDADELK
ncbi:MAG: tetraacyldisaccharide 4'-kinase [Opitutales bacterium]